MSGSAQNQDQWTRWGPAGLRLVTGTFGARLGQAQSLTNCSASDEPRAGVATSGPSPRLPPACTRGLPRTHPHVPLLEARTDPAPLGTAPGRALQALTSPPPGPRAAQAVLSRAPRGCEHPYECRECMFYLGPRPLQSKASVFPQCHVRQT